MQNAIKLITTTIVKSMNEKIRDISEINVANNANTNNSNVDGICPIYNFL